MKNQILLATFMMISSLYSLADNNAYTEANDCIIAHNRIETRNPNPKIDPSNFKICKNGSSLKIIKETGEVLLDDTVQTDFGFSSGRAITTKTRSLMINVGKNADGDLGNILVTGKNIMDTYFIKSLPN